MKKGWTLSPPEQRAFKATPGRGRRVLSQRRWASIFGGFLNEPLWSQNRTLWLKRPGGFLFNAEAV